MGAIMPVAEPGAQAVPPSGMPASRPGWGFAAAVLVAGTAASLVSSLALAAAGRRELGSAPAPLNGPSQWVHGTHAPYRNGFDAKHTLVGYAIHHWASLFWATIYEVVRRIAGLRRPAQVAALAAGTSAVAALVDFKLTPRRLRPGFERRLSRRSLVLVYAAFAAGLAVGTLTSPRDR